MNINSPLRTFNFQITDSLKIQYKKFLPLNLITDLFQPVIQTTLPKRCFMQQTSVKYLI